MESSSNYHNSMFSANLILKLQKKIKLVVLRKMIQTTISCKLNSLLTFIRGKLLLKIASTALSMTPLLTSMIPRKS